MTDLVHAVSRYSPIPLYRQIADHLEARVGTDLAPGDRLPSESELAAEFGVNRLTVRSALADLARRGVVETVHGRGTFVAEPTIRYDVAAGRDASFTRAMRANGHDVQTRLLTVRTTDDPELRAELHTRGDVRRVDILRLVDQRPWSVTSTWIAAGRYRDIERWWTGSESLYEILESRYGVRMRRAGRTFAAVPATPFDTEHLMVPIASAVLLVRGLNIDDDARPVAVVEHRFRGDRVQFSVDLA